MSSTRMRVKSITDMQRHQQLVDTRMMTEKHHQQLIKEGELADSSRELQYSFEKCPKSPSPRYFIEGPFHAVKKVLNLHNLPQSGKFLSSQWENHWTHDNLESARCKLRDNEISRYESGSKQNDDYWVALPSM